MKRVATSRRRHVGVLRRRPRLDPAAVTPESGAAVRRLDELRALIRLVDRGLLSPEELEREQLKVHRGARA
ncbi:MAG: hypothetical protein H6529_10650 [Nocardioides sp.]|nr:hypothetical protein [Nocardioides sp.]